jgi:hypothetical protein
VSHRELDPLLGGIRNLLQVSAADFLPNRRGVKLNRSQSTNSLGVSVSVQNGMRNARINEPE